MKKIMMMFTAILCCVMLFTSCSKSDDKGGGSPSVPDTTPVSVAFIYQLQVSQDMIDYLDVSLEYYDASGNVKSEPVTKTNWQSSKITAKLPATVAARLNFKEKSGVDYSKVDKVLVATGLTHAGSLVNKAGADVGVISAQMSLSEVTVPGNKVESFIAEKGLGYRKFFYNYDASGTKKSGSWN